MATSWPPVSPKAALLSSPSGRRKYQRSKEHPNSYTSPTKQRTTTVNLQRCSHGLLDMGGDIGGGGAMEKEEEEDDKEEDEDEDEDEETLQLKLAAITAKLKLKKLQQRKTRSQGEPLEIMPPEDKSSGGALAQSAVRKDGRDSTVRSQESAIVPISPAKKLAPSTEQRSPRRVLLGIDKGIRGDDVSLRRARTARDGTAPRLASRLDGLSSRRSAFSSVRATASSTMATGGHFKSFSERMAESRSVEKSKESHREAITKRQSSAFKLDQAEVQTFHTAAHKARSNSPLGSDECRKQVDFQHDDILHSYGDQGPASSQLEERTTVPTLGRPLRQPLSLDDDDDDGHQSAGRNLPRGDASLFEPFSQLHLSTRILPHTFLERTLPDESYTLLRLPDLLKSVSAPSYDLPESVVDYVVFGIIASKSSPQDHKAGIGNAKSAATSRGSNDWEKQWEDGSQNQKKFMVFQLTDLTWSVDLFLFGTALPRYHRLSLGTVVAILNPSIMPPRKGKEDTGAFSLTLHSGDDTVLEIGTARDLGFCKAVKKNGKDCGSWVNSSKTEYCEWHLNAQVSKTQAGRMGVNTGSNGASLFGASGTRSRSRFSSAHGPRHRGEAKERHGLLPKQGGQQFDARTGSHYFLASSGGGSQSRTAEAPGYHPDQSPANLLDMDDDNPFVTGGHLSRDKESRLRKRLVAQEKERKIARNLAVMNSGGAGGEYIRQQLAVESSSTSQPGSQRSALAMKMGIMNDEKAGKGTGKRPAESVRLSPMKKTRLLTEKGIRHPGRESLGAKKGPGSTDDEDDLDIV